MASIPGISAIVFLAIFIVCFWDYKRIPVGKVEEFLAKSPNDFIAIAFSIFKLFVLTYSFYVVSRQVIGFPAGESLWTINWNFPLAGIISLLSSAPIIGYLALRQRSKSKTVSKTTLSIAFCVAMFVSGFGQISVAAISAAAPLSALGKMPIYLMAFSMVTGFILTVSAIFHYAILLNFNGLSQSELKRKFVIDSFNAALSSVLSILVAASFWTFSAL